MSENIVELKSFGKLDIISSICKCENKSLFLIHQVVEKLILKLIAGLED